MDEGMQKHVDELVEDLKSAKARLISLLDDSSKTPLIIRSLSQIHVKIDEAYQWIVVGLSAALEQGSQANIESAAAKAQADGKLRIAEDEPGEG
jgi:hypothetical protein